MMVKPRVPVISGRWLCVADDAILWGEGPYEFSLGPVELTVYIQQKASGHNFNLDKVKILDCETWWFEHGFKEAICVTT